MSISGVNGIGATSYTYMNNSRKTTEESNFASEVQKAGESQNTTATASAWAGAACAGILFYAASERLKKAGLYVRMARTAKGI